MNRRSNSAAVPERRRLMSPGQILLFGLMVLAGLMAVYSGQPLQRRLETSAFSDALSMAYLEAWLRAQPEDDRLRLQLAQRRVAAGQLDTASFTLAPLLDDANRNSPYHAGAEALYLDILNQRLWQHLPGMPAFTQARLVVLAQMEKLAQLTQEPAQLEGFIRQALALDAPDQAILFYHRLQGLRPHDSARITEEIAALQIGQHRYRDAAATYFRAMDSATDLNERRRFFLAGLSALQSGNLMNDALAAAQARWRALEGDVPTLEFLARLARRANRLDMAEFYVSRLLSQPVNHHRGERK